MKSTAIPKTNRPSQSKPAKIVFYLPPDARLSDVFIDGPQVIQELFIHKRTLSNWRKDGRITFTNRFGKIFYLTEQEVDMQAGFAPTIFMMT